MKDKTSITTAKKWRQQKNRIEAQTDPGNKTGWKIECCAMDPGPEFKGAMDDEMAQAKLVVRRGETDRHTDQALVENLNQRVQYGAAAMAQTAMGDNVELYAPMVGALAVEWATELVNFTAVTKEQKEQKVTAHQQQFNCEETLYNAFGIEIAPYLTLCYCFILKKNRDNKLSPKAVRCLWAGVNRENVHSTKCIPITKDNGLWKLGKCQNTALARTLLYSGSRF